MKGTDWLAFLGPVLVALVAVVGPLVKARLELRDRRAQIRADLELLDLLPEKLDGRDALVTSIDRRVRLLASSSLPRVWRLDRRHRERRIALTWAMSIFMFFFVFAYTVAIWLATTREQRIISWSAFLVAGLVFLVLRWMRGKVEVKETTELYDDEMSRLTEHGRQLQLETERQKRRGDELLAALEERRSEADARIRALEARAAPPRQATLKEGVSRVLKRLSGRS
ncbi:hypothetical protein [Nocardia brasiliensis]|uniref:hypothetical protein n=1 Tax=Nocardia brasiliensis TaxID=37326 RepID=UPI00245572B2|nr:hypothetical protein [Nocardia brasiliensis]